MAFRADATAASCSKALTAFVEDGKALLDLAKKESGEGSLLEFVRQKIRIEQQQSLLGLIEAGAALYRSLCVQRKKDAEDLWRKSTHRATLQGALQDFQELEVQWDAFLQHLDDELQLAVQTLDDTEQIKCISPDTSLIDARTGEKVTLEKYFGRGQKILLVLIRQFSCLLCRLHLKELEKHQCSLDSHSIQVLVISFGCQEGASHWLKETGCQYDMLLDSDRKILKDYRHTLSSTFGQTDIKEMYTAFGLGASLKKVLSFSNMLLYAEYVVDNMEFPRGLPSIQDDMFQLGGDFVLDEHGRVLFSHCCQSPIDRPSVEDILSGQ